MAPLDLGDDNISFSIVITTTNYNLSKDNGVIKR